MKVMQIAIIAIMIFIVNGCSQSESRQEQIDSIVSELIKSDAFIQNSILPVKNALLRSNYYKQGMIVNESEQDKKVNFTDPVEIRKYYDLVYGKKFGQNMLKLESGLLTAQSNFINEFNLKYKNVDKQVFKEAFIKANILVKRNNRLSDNKNFFQTN